MAAKDNAQAAEATIAVAAEGAPGIPKMATMLEFDFGIRQENENVRLVPRSQKKIKRVKERILRDRLSNEFEGGQSWEVHVLTSSHLVDEGLRISIK